MAPPFWIVRNSWGPDWGDAGHMRMDIQGGYGVCGINTLPGIYPVVRSPGNPCNSNAVDSNGDPLLNPCGSFACTVEGTSNRCACDGTVYVEANNTDGSRTCTPVDVCGLGPSNPCGVGTCVNDGLGSYSCVCPPDFRQGTTVEGFYSCAPAVVAATKYVVQGAKVTCAHIRLTMGLSLAELKARNPALDCNADIPLKTIVNVTANVAIPTCTSYYTTGESDTCLGLAQRHNLSDSCEPKPGQCVDPSLPCVPPCVQAFEALNPGIDCEAEMTGNLPKYISVCVKQDPLYLPRVPSCPMLRTALPGETCDELRSMVVGNMTLEEFLTINPGINCNKLRPALTGSVPSPTSFDVCLAGIFDNQMTNCPRPIKVVKGDKCDAVLLKSFGGSHDCFRQINGYECLDDLVVGDVMCTPDPAFLARGICTV
eukprot:TRINITY_DN11274_c0_g2_i1.p1 TRINITY_DN11274_c0_g2~~TRINITY_DN11274_c0_g2_i1.p1  ORF type:complete len:465 (+),score=0.46 TRINITY_DN11274_c0_g2_i1:120-1397(+)